LIWGLMDLVGELVRLRGEVCGHLEVNSYSVVVWCFGLHLV
jgi:hypothetical protein